MHEKIQKNQANSISAELLELNLKNKLEETGKQDERERNRKARRKKHQNRKKLFDTLTFMGTLQVRTK